MGVIPVRSLLLLELSQPLVVALDLLAEQRVLVRRALRVQLESARPVQPLQVQPAAPHHAHAVHYEAGHEVNLEQHFRISHIF